MAAHAWNEDGSELIGTLRWNEFEGGFWTLDFAGAGGDAADAPPAPWGGSVVLGQDPPLPPGAGDGAIVRVRGHACEDMLDFLMAGTRYEVHEATIMAS